MNYAFVTCFVTLMVAVPEVLNGQISEGRKYFKDNVQADIQAEKKEYRSMVWGFWSEWSECSRTCGGGSSYSIRKCNIGHEMWCHIEFSRKYRTCNNQDCPKDSMDFRAKQCSAYNDVQRNGGLHRWVPAKRDQFAKGSECTLTCRAYGNEKLVVEWASQVLDGTRCKDGSPDMCIAGRCQYVGCDRVLHSTAKYDVCGICGGDGTSCKLETGIHLRDPQKPAGSDYVISVPARSRHVVVTEKGSSHISLRIGTDRINVTKLRERKAKDVILAADSRIEYGSSSPGKEYINVKGPLPLQMDVVVTYDAKPWKYVRYEYHRPYQYTWRYNTSQSGCTVTCGGGLRFTWPRCVEEISDKFVDKDKCIKEGLQIPEPQAEHCNSFYCSSFGEGRILHPYEHMEYYRWSIGPWTKCSKTCAGGLQTRAISCVTETLLGKIVMADSESRCDGIERPAKATVWQKCNTDPCPFWTSQKWSPCSATCGMGTQFRVVRCQFKGGAPAFDCDDTKKPAVNRKCLARLSCFELKEAPVIKILGPPTEMPNFQKAALVGREVFSISTEPSWVADLWGPCSLTCGSGGISTREVKCRVYLEFVGSIEDLEDYKCTEEKPPISKSCFMGGCLSEEHFHQLNSPKLIVHRLEHDYDAEYISDFSPHIVEAQYSPLVEENGDDNNWMEYEDAVTYPTVDPNEYQNYEWIYAPFGECAPSCDNGMQRSEQICVIRKSQSRAADDRCDPSLLSSPMLQPCNEGPCLMPASGPPEEPVRWEISSYGECSTHCGRGVQSRSVVCRKIPDGIPTSRARGGMRLPEIMCPSPKPQTTRACSLAACEPEWIPTTWSECSRTCGRGVQVRDSQCMQRLATGLTERVPEDYCPHIRPEQRRKCAISDCPPRYNVKQWTECSVTCGNGVQLREAICMRIPAGGGRAEEVSIRHCSHLTLPVLKRGCKMRKCREGGSSSHHVPSREARIVTEDRTFVQRGKESKVRLVVGMKAYVFPRTTVVMRCPVLRYKKALIYWKFNGTEIETDDYHFTLLKDGSFRVRYVEQNDVGRYTCVAGDAEADLTLNFVGAGSASIHRAPEPGHDVDVDIGPGPVKLKRGEPLFPKRVEYQDVRLDPGVQYPTIDEVQNLIGGTARSSETSAAIGGELIREAPKLENIAPEHPHESGALSPKPITVLAQNQWDIPKLLEPEDDIGTDGQQHDDSASLNLGNSVLVVNQQQPEDHVDALPDLWQDAEDFSDIPMPDTVEEELLLLLTAAGVNKPSEEVQNILSQGILPNTDGEEDHSVKFAPPIDIPLSSVEVDDELSLLSEDGEDHFDTASSEHVDIDSIPISAPDTDYLLPDHLSNRPSEREVPNIPQLVSFRSPPKILAQPTVQPMQLGSEVETYVGGTLIVSDAESVTLLCEASGHPKPNLEWYKDDVKVISDGRRIILPDNSLRLLHPTQEEGGSYTCKATNVLGTDSTSTLLNVAMVPHIRSTIDNKIDIQSRVVEVPIGSIIKARLGAIVRIACNVDGFPEPYVQWNKDVSGLGDNMQVLPDNSLEISPTNKADQGVYSCEASSPVGTDYQASALVLFDPPRYSDEFDVDSGLEAIGMYGFPRPIVTAPLPGGDFKVKAGSTVLMGCPVVGFPEPAMTWTFDGRPLHEFSQQLGYQLLLGGKILQLPDIDGGSTGDYRCHATNGGGNITTSLRLRLIEYSYVSGNLTTCSASCGGKGTQYKTLVCVEDGVKPVDDWFCTGISKPTQKLIPCNREDCPPRFHTSPWSPCTRTCGEGERTRIVSCRVLRSDDTDITVMDTECTGGEVNASMAVGKPFQERPIDRQPCLLEACPTWQPGPWSKCTRRCYGRGTSAKVRRLYCVRANGTHVPRSECRQSARPRRRQYCPTKRCEPVWIAGRWSRCSHSCGTEGIQTRILSCVYRGNRRQRAGALCSKDVRPPVTAPCNRINCDQGPKASPSRPEDTCVDKSRYCKVAKSSGLCSFYKYLCCRTCR